MEDKMVEEIMELWKTDFGIKVASDDGDISIYNKTTGNDIGYLGGDYEHNKKALKEAISKGNDFFIEEWCQVYLTTGESIAEKNALISFKEYEEKNTQKYCELFNEKAKYWKVSVSIEDIENNGGWQFVEFWKYEPIIEEDDTMTDIKYLTNEEATKRFIQNNWHIYDGFGEDDFLQFLQLEMLKNIDIANYGSTKDQKRYKKYAKIDVKEVIKNAYKIIHNGTFYDVANDESEREDRGWLLNDAKELLCRLDNESLRDIVFHHPMRDIQDSEYDDERINSENLYHFEFRHHLVKEAIDEVKAEDNIIKNYLKEIDDDWDDCDCIYKALTLVLGTQEQSEWENIYSYITNIIKKFDKNENDEYKFAKKDIIDEINWRKRHNE